MKIKSKTVDDKWPGSVTRNSPIVQRPARVTCTNFFFSHWLFLYWCIFAHLQLFPVTVFAFWVHTVVRSKRFIWILPVNKLNVQKLLRLCEQELEAIINARKSRCLRICHSNSSCCCCCSINTTNGVAILWTDEIRYLCIFIMGSRVFKCSFTYAKKSFCRSVNAIFAPLDRTANVSLFCYVVWKHARWLNLICHFWTLYFKQQILPSRTAADRISVWTYPASYGLNKCTRIWC